jgi:hypothetical protein
MQSRDKVTELKRRSRYLVVLLAPDNPAGLAEKFRNEKKLESAQKNRRCQWSERDAEMLIRPVLIISAESLAFNLQMTGHRAYGKEHRLQHQ